MIAPSSLPRPPLPVPGTLSPGPVPLPPAQPLIPLVIPAAAADNSPLPLPSTVGPATVPSVDMQYADRTASSATVASPPYQVPPSGQTFLVLPTDFPQPPTALPGPSMSTIASPSPQICPRIGALGPGPLTSSTPQLALPSAFPAPSEQPPQIDCPGAGYASTSILDEMCFTDSPDEAGCPREAGSVGSSVILLAFPLFL
ncbi:unnamed protein product [Gongylonema pulchrum]|uniref:Uncharacterized protein n=1 Tax=Gongylonema pulchrum TaxID=637853 RepID=A0A3P7NVJ3_9BILA|nr:unnamed protein product [Gongylonema pulchrum]